MKYKWEKFDTEKAMKIARDKRIFDSIIYCPKLFPSYYNCDLTITMKLHVDKIDKELIRLGKPKSWLAKQCGISRALLNYRMQNRTLAGVEDIARVLDYDPKDLIK